METKPDFALVTACAAAQRLREAEAAFNDALDNVEASDSARDVVNAIVRRRNRMARAELARRRTSTTL